MPIELALGDVVFDEGLERKRIVSHQVDYHEEVLLKLGLVGG